MSQGWNVSGRNGAGQNKPGPKWFRGIRVVSPTLSFAPSRFAHFPFRTESFGPRVVSPTFPFAPPTPSPESFRILIKFCFKLYLFIFHGLQSLHQPWRIMVDSAFFVKSTPLRAFTGSFQHLTDMLQTYWRCAWRSLMLKKKFFDRVF